jgi:hypothetical protein
MNRNLTFTARLMPWIVGGALLIIPGLGLAAESGVDDRIQKLEQRIEQMQKQVQQPRQIDWEQVEKRIEKLERQQPASQGGETGNMVTFRGGFAGATSDRSGETFTDTFGFTGTNNGQTGHYVGAALDLVLTKNVWGMMSDTWVMGEIGVEFKRFDSRTVTVAVPTTCNLASSGAACPGQRGKVQITMLTVSIAPKIKFMEGSRFRPWIIPAGLDFQVISPPSNDTTYLDIGVQFGAGADYRVWEAVHVGVDARFHLTAGNTDTTNNFGTIGPYVGLAF